MFNILWWIFHFLNSYVTLNICNIPQQELFACTFSLDGPSYFPAHWSSFPYSLSSWILWTAIPQSFPLKSEYSCKICLHLPKPVNRAPWWEGDICLAWFPSRSPQDLWFPWGGRRLWDRQQRAVLCPALRVTDGRTDRGTGEHQSMSRPGFAGTFPALLFLAGERFPGAGLDWSPVGSIALLPGCLCWLLAGCREG